MGQQPRHLSPATAPIAALLCLALAACAAPVRKEPPPIARLSLEEVARIGFVYPKPVTLDEVIALRRAGTPPEEIIRRMRESASVYRLTEVEIERLAAAGVAREVLDHMTAQQRAEQEAMARAQAWRQLEADPWPWYGPYYGPAWGPGFGVGVHRHWRHFGAGVGWGHSGPWWW